MHIYPFNCPGIQDMHDTIYNLYNSKYAFLMTQLNVAHIIDT